MMFLSPDERRVSPVARPVPVGPSRPRKVGLVGGAPASLACAPWQDPSWEFWAHASVVQALPPGRCDRLFDLHPKHCFTERLKHGFANYYEFLQRCSTPIYMQEQYQAIPSAVKYPLALVQQQWPGTPFGSMAAYMIALALLEGVTTIGLFGIDYQHESEYEEQRANCEHWVGIAKGAGVQVIIPTASPLCHEPTMLYAYETHATPELYEARKARVAQYKKKEGPQGGPFSASRLVPNTPESDAASDALLRAREPAWEAAITKMVDDIPMPESMRHLAPVEHE
jgi:hypothetical protein